MTGEREPASGTGRLTGSQVLGMLTGSMEGPAARFRVSRPCYDKLRRCPGWAGGGLRYARVRRCDNGYLKTYDEDGMLPLWRWRLYRCPKCQVIVLPYMTRWLDWRWVSYRVARSWRELAYRAQQWQEEAREDAAEFPSYWQQRWPLPVRAALFPLGFAVSSVAWFLTDVADRLLPGAIDASAYWYNRRARKDNRKANEKPGNEGENGNQV